VPKAAHYRAFLSLILVVFPSFINPHAGTRVLGKYNEKIQN
jgi:hypothetical protein